MIGRLARRTRRQGAVADRVAEGLRVAAILLSLAAIGAAPLGCGRSDASDEARGAGETAPAPIVVREASMPTTTSPPPVEPAPRPIGPLPLGTNCMTSECHATFLTARQIHGAVSTGDCTICHEQDAGGHTYPLKREGNANCTFCHAVTGNHTHQHAALDAPGCIACHQPHVSDTKFLLTGPSIETVCRQCHLLEPGTHAHGPFAKGECTACHEPHESNSAGLLRGGEGPEHCYMCHAETRFVMENAPFQHAPAMTDCTTCHSPHATNEEHALALPIQQACFTCHEDIEKTVTGATAPHGAVFTAERCANCHDPHGAGRANLLRDRQDTLCLQCHDREIRAEDGRKIANMTPLLTDREFLHGPVASGDCAACHNVHGASQGRLLRESFTEDFYQSFDIGSYALCFGCHQSDLVLTEETTALTGFRDGARNLHFLHVNRERKGRTCRTCHEIHGSNRPQHMAASVPFEGSQWAMPIDFTRTDGGGRCAPGCHEPMEYRRDLPIEPPSPAPNGGLP